MEIRPTGADAMSLVNSYERHIAICMCSLQDLDEATQSRISVTNLSMYEPRQQLQIGSC